MGQLVKAYLYNVDKGATELECLFNPTDYSFSKSNEWKLDKITSQNVPVPSFQGGGVMSMKFQLFFDTYDPSARGGSSADAQKDVRQYTQALLDLMKIDPDLKNKDKKAKKGRPPICSFNWGDYWSFKGVIKSVSLKFTLFTEEGRPVRATADVELAQVMEEGLYPKQNPTSGGEGTQASRIVLPGDTLDLIAYQEYGDSGQWRALAAANHLEDPRHLEPGQRLVVPAL